MLKILAYSLLLLHSILLMAAPSPILLPYWAAENSNSVQSIDHQRWQTFLDKYLVQSEQQQLVRYNKVNKADKNSLVLYTKTLANIDPGSLNRKEQMAYWINLYNALTIITVLDHYPVKSILDIRSSWFSPGPWKNKIIEISGYWLSLNDIEHGILRPIYQDPRIHYALNCASMGCPNLQPRAFTGTNAEQLLQQAASDFINSDKGFKVHKSGARLSKIYEWYEDDFGNTTEDLVSHLNLYLDDTISNQELNNMKFQYDWTINEATE